MMEMGEYEICNRYRHAKHKGEQLEILAELNDVPRHKIIGILLENGENVKLPIRTRGRKRNTDFTEKEYQKALLNRLDELDGQISDRENEFKDICTVLFGIRFD